MALNDLRQNIAFSEEAINNFCQQHHVRKLAFFGSVLSDNSGPDSDVDALLESIISP